MAADGLFDFLDSDLPVASSDIIATDGYEIDSRIRNLSYSSILKSHECPRKFQLYRLNADTTSEEDVEQTVTFAYGHAIGDGMADLLQDISLDQTILNMYLNWGASVTDTNVAAQKSLFTAIFAIQHFNDMITAGYLDEYELVYIGNKPAVELSFSVDLGDGFQYGGFIDAVLRHKSTKAIVVLEVKTTKMTNINPSMFKNSAQGLGYSVVLDHLFPEMSAYEVLYLVYSTGTKNFTPLPFTKTLIQRAIFLQTLQIEKAKIELYEANAYPMHGESCFNWYRDCEYLGICTLETSALLNGMHKPRPATVYDFNFTLEELIETQIIKGEL